MKIATWNVNSIKARLEPALAWLKEAKPDVVALQEIKTVDENFPREAFEALGYNCAVHGQKSYNGVALLCKRPMEDVTPRLHGDETDDHARYLEAVITGDKGAVRVASIYAPNGNPWPGPKFDYKLGWFERLAIRASELVGRDTPVILAGDYNVIPTDMDVYKPERWVDDALFRPETRAAYHRLLEQGWTDAVRTLHPGERIYTFWDYFRNAYGRDAGLRIDHLLLNPFIARRLRRAGVDRHVRGWEKTSDHAPTWIELECPP